MKGARARDLIGRRIVGVRLRVFHAGRQSPSGGPVWAHDPTLILDNGRELSFVTEETENGEYGVRMDLSTRRKS